MSERTTDEDLALLDDLGVDTAPAASGTQSAREQRIIAGFEEIARFVEEHGRKPEHGDGRDIFERLYAVRLDRLRESAECREVLKGLDSRGLLDPGNDQTTLENELDDEELLASLGVAPTSEAEVTRLVHVRPRDEIKAAEEIAQRNPCPDFDQFQSIFEAVQRDLESGERATRKYKDSANIRQGDLFILDGQKVIVADLGERFVSDYGRPDRRLRVVYENGTESDLLLRSLQRALNKDKTSRRIVKPDIGPLFSDIEETSDLAAGCIYVLRSESEHPFVKEHRTLIHKIGVTGGDVKGRIANARKDPTYLLADVEIVAEYKLANVNRKALEALLHKFFAAARLDLELKDRFGFQVEPQEWFLVPLPVIDEAIRRIKDGTISAFRHDPATATLTRAGDDGEVPQN
jgi:hypothetical protein